MSRSRRPTSYHDWLVTRRTRSRRSRTHSFCNANVAICLRFSGLQFVLLRTTLNKPNLGRCADVVGNHIEANSLRAIKRLAQYTHEGCQRG